MASERTWPVEPSNWHVAEDTDGRWRVFQEGEATARDRLDTREDAVQAAEVLAQEVPEARVLVHNPDGTLQEVRDLDE